MEMPLNIIKKKIRKKKKKDISCQPWLFKEIPSRKSSTLREGKSLPGSLATLFYTNKSKEIFKIQIYCSTSPAQDLLFCIFLSLGSERRLLVSLLFSASFTFIHWHNLLYFWFSNVKDSIYIYKQSPLHLQFVQFTSSFCSGH